MKTLILLLFASCFVFTASSQRVYFMYLQSENNAPFYVRMGDKIHSSTVSGYLIMSELVDSTYSFAVGFAGSPDASKFKISLDNKDRGFLIKKIDDKLNLFDLESLTLHKPVLEQLSSKYSYQRRGDAFSKLLSKAVNDSSLLYVRVEIQEPKKAPHEIVQVKDTTQASITEAKTVAAETTPPVIDSSVVNANLDSGKVAIDNLATMLTDPPVRKDAVKKDSVVTENPIASENINPVDSIAIVSEYKRSVIVRHSESSTTEGFGLVFLDKMENYTDTIRLLIPNQKTPFQLEEQKSSVQDQKNFLDIADSVPVIRDTAMPIKDTQIISCLSQASNRDFLKLRKNMAAEEGEEAMLKVAAADFAQRCYTVDQIKNLSALFLNTDDKLSFFELSYRHVSDKENFRVLQSELKEENHLNRFKLIISQ